MKKFKCTRDSAPPLVTPAKQSIHLRRLVRRILTAPAEDRPAALNSYSQTAESEEETQEAAGV